MSGNMDGGGDIRFSLAKEKKNGRKNLEPERYTNPNYCLMNGFCESPRQFPCLLFIGTILRTNKKSKEFADRKLLEIRRLPESHPRH